MKRLLITFILLALIALQLFAQPTQIIHGVVIDNATDKPVPFASVILTNSGNLATGSTTDTLGNFIIPSVSVGRYDLQVSFIGYQTALYREITVVSGKQTFLNVRLSESVATLEQVLVRPSVNKELPLNRMATLSARMMSAEEAKRYAGGFDDPARLATSFAGVAGNTGQNGIIVRGNAPKFMQWRMEGVEIPAPNHFGDLQMVGGGLLTALSSQMLDNSDFFTGAFPAEYSNALSGVFDINMRKGNNEKREHTVQVGLIGIDFSSEGPFQRGKRSSYLFNYRYSTLALLKPLLPENADGINYQDLSFKLHFPTKKLGIFSVWGIGLIDGAGAKPKMDSTKWRYYDDRQKDDISLYTGTLGFGHKYFLKNNAFIKTTLAVSTNQTDWVAQKLNDQMVLRPQDKFYTANSNLILTSFLNKTFGPKHNNRTGFVLTGMGYDLKLNRRFNNEPMPTELANSNGMSALLAVYSQSNINISSKLQLNAGISGQYFALNGRYSIEPRLGLKYHLKSNHALGLAYGLHSRMEQLYYLLNNSNVTGEKAVNKNLDFTRSHHFVLSYDWNVTELFRVKIEPYFQYLFSVPVTTSGSLSMLNLQRDWFFAQKLFNTGEGRNYGLDITLEKFMSKGFYFLLSGSVFRSEYRGGDGQWRSTRYDRGFVTNFLTGKEWQTGKKRQNVLSVNVRASYQGGNRYSPVDLVASRVAQDVVFDETRAFSQQFASAINLHFTASFKMNKSKNSQEIALKVLNITQQSDFNGFLYNYQTGGVDPNTANIAIPNLSYKIEF